MVAKKGQKQQRQKQASVTKKVVEVVMAPPAPPTNEELAKLHETPAHSLHLNKAKDTAFLKVTLHKIPPKFIVFEATPTHILVHTLKFTRKLFLFKAYPEGKRAVIVGEPEAEFDCGILRARFTLEVEEGDQNKETSEVADETVVVAADQSALKKRPRSRVEPPTAAVNAAPASKRQKVSEKTEAVVEDQTVKKTTKTTTTTTASAASTTTTKKTAGKKGAAVVAVAPTEVPDLEDLEQLADAQMLVHSDEPSTGDEADQDLLASSAPLPKKKKFSTVTDQLSILEQVNEVEDVRRNRKVAKEEAKLAWSSSIQKVKDTRKKVKQDKHEAIRKMLIQQEAEKSELKKEKKKEKKKLIEGVKKVVAPVAQEAPKKPEAIKPEPAVAEPDTPTEDQPKKSILKRGGASPAAKSVKFSPKVMVKPIPKVKKPDTAMNRQMMKLIARQLAVSMAPG
eukprot:CAMPEP_0184332816 /NCGR_PEP_ID=MMETSP1089-20130417/1958_1 /TAXON_ID=38269 ORGANISM="Gloeochaete wittrockiana, Strain SAG46.84" /NCGR_SAMPLE_ID=MMETSP1089 /ASSEMBLY_ACC=CAM_ASM_000445 /LENGTH=451 /DNA_ID=CAMNT_0026656375 /DNA_START=57 /DNA_END=1408 /DNA_ORIENTATION=+